MTARLKLPGMLEALPRTMAVTGLTIDDRRLRPLSRFTACGDRPLCLRDLDVLIS